jgi:hypothetical protein
LTVARLSAVRQRVEQYFASLRFAMNVCAQ